MTNFNRFGSVSTGTLRSFDLLDAFRDEVDSRGINKDARTSLLCSVVEAISEIADDCVTDAFNACEWASEAVNELQDLLNEDLPPFVRFGSHEGDGSDIGYWFDHDAFEDSVQDGETLKVADLADAPWFKMPEECHQVAVISDHGNVSLYTRSGEHLYSIA